MYILMIRILKPQCIKAMKETSLLSKIWDICYGTNNVTIENALAQCFMWEGIIDSLMCEENNSNMDTRFFILTMDNIREYIKFIENRSQFTNA